MGDIRKKFGERIKSERLNKGLSQEQLAELAEIDRTYIGGVERGERNISLVNIEKLSKALGKKLSDIFIGL